MVEQLLREFPSSRGLFEYEDFLAAQTRGSASEFITRAIEDNYEQIAKMENYVDYIANRPRVQKLGAHGLFTADDGPLVLSQVADEVAHHPGVVWLPIISLRREDAARLGYDSAESWRSLLTRQMPEMAKAMKIPLDQLRWYAAFHDEGNHPHVHMVCYSADNKMGRWIAIFIQVFAVAFSFYGSNYVMRKHGGLKTSAFQEIAITMIVFAGICVIASVIALKDKDKPEFYRGIAYGLCTHRSLYCCR